MGTIDRATIAELMQRAESLDLGPTRVTVLEEAVRLADMLADVPLGYEARTKLIEAAQYSGSPDKAIAAFSWCLAQFDRDPSAFDEKMILWEYKWIISNLTWFPQISRAQIEGALVDFTARVERSGFGMRPVYKLRWRDAFSRGEIDEAEAAFELWSKSPLGELSDCAACERNEEIEFLVTWRRDEEAIERARPILDGSLTCRSVPHTTIPKLFLPLLRLGRVAEATALHLKGYRLIARKPAFIVESGLHLRFLALTDNLAEGVKLFETEFPVALATRDLIHRLMFVNRARFLFDRLKAHGKPKVMLRLPRSFHGFEESGDYDVSGLASWLESDAAELARRFDERNGNNSVASWLDDPKELRALVTPYPLRSQGAGSRAGRSGPSVVDASNRPSAMPGRNPALHFSRFLAKLVHEPFAVGRVLVASFRSTFGRHPPGRPR